MKKVLSLLMTFVFLQAQTWALSGGPNYNTPSDFPNSLIGTYGGVFIPTSSTNPAAATSTAAPSIGIFSLAVTDTGIAGGNAIIFVRGAAFIGQMAAIADPDKKKIDGVFGATSPFTVQVPVINPVTGAVTFQSFPNFAEGVFKIKVKEGDAGAFTPAPPGSGSGTGTGTGTGTTSTSLEVGSTNSARLSGTAQIDTFFRFNTTTGSPIVSETTTFAVDGFKQSNIPTIATALSFNLTGP